MRPAATACRSLDRVCADLAAEYGRLDVVRESVEVSPDEYDRLRDRAETFDQTGGAGAWVHDHEGSLLLVRGDDGWAEPGRTQQPGESPLECARRAVEEQTGLSARLVDCSHVHVRYARDWTDRDPIPQPFVVFEADARGTPEAGDSVAAAAWHESRPASVLYEYLETAFE